MDAALQLLLPDGAVRVAFHPRLTAEQFAEVMELAECAESKEDLESMVKSASAAFGIAVTIEHLS